MPLDSRLENYLGTLDRVLRPVPASERADIVMEIKSHVLSALERDPAASTESVLRALGEPETVANRYLMERGLKPAKPPISPVVKWLVLGSLGAMALGILALGILLFSFSPLIKVSESEGKVVLLGGLIDVDDAKGRVKIGDAEFFENSGKKAFAGEATVAPKGNVSVILSQGRLTITTASDQTFRWKCRGHEKDSDPKIESREGAVVLDMKYLRGATCEIEVPKASALHAAVDNGKLSIEKPAFNVDASLDNGRILIKADPAFRYAYEFKIDNGRADHPPSDPAPDFRVNAKVDNGKISVE